MVNNTPTILIIGGKDKSKCYSEKGITRVPYQPIDVLRLGHLYAYDAVIFWPSWVDDSGLNMTKGELKKALPNIVTIQDIESAHFSQSSSSTDPNNGEIHIDLDGLEFPDDKDTKRKGKKSQLDVPKIHPVNISKDKPDSDKMLDFDDYKRVQKLFNDKLLEIIAGISRKQLAFIIIPSAYYNGQNPDDIIGWMKMPFEIDPERADKDKISFTAKGQHAIYAIMKGMNSIVNEWAFRFITGQFKDEYNNHLDQSDVNIVIPFPFNDYALTIRDVHVTVRVGHTDRGGFAYSLMILSEQGGLAFIPEPKSIDDLVELISNSIAASVEPSVSKPVVAESLTGQLPTNILTLDISVERKPISGQTDHGWEIICNGKEANGTNDKIEDITDHKVVIGHRAFLILLSHIIAIITGEIGIDPRRPKLNGKDLSPEIYLPKKQKQIAKPAQQVNDAFKDAGINTRVLEAFRKKNIRYYRLASSVKVSDTFFSHLKSMQPKPLPDSLATLLKIYDSKS